MRVPQRRDHCPRRPPREQGCSDRRWVWRCLEQRDHRKLATRPVPRGHPSQLLKGGVSPQGTSALNPRAGSPQGRELPLPPPAAAKPKPCTTAFGPESQSLFAIPVATKALERGTLGRPPPPSLTRLLPSDTTEFCLLSSFTCSSRKLSLPQNPPHGSSGLPTATPARLCPRHQSPAVQSRPCLPTTLTDGWPPLSRSRPCRLAVCLHPPPPVTPHHRQGRPSSQRAPRSQSPPVPVPPCGKLLELPPWGGVAPALLMLVCEHCRAKA